MIGWVDTIVQGVLLGGLYALFAMGQSLIFGVMRLTNIAHGDFIILAAFGGILAGRWPSASGWRPRLAGHGSGAAVTFGAGYGLQRVLLNRTLGPRPRCRRWW